MGIIDELSRLRALRESDALTDLEFEHAKAIALQEGAVLTEKTNESARLAVIECENKLLKIEQEWDRERVLLLTKHNHEPTIGDAISVGVIAVISGGGMILFGINDPANGGAAFVPIGFLMLVILLLIAAHFGDRATRFKEAKLAYESRRVEAAQNIEAARARLQSRT